MTSIIDLDRRDHLPTVGHSPFTSESGRQVRDGLTARSARWLLGRGLNLFAVPPPRAGVKSGSPGDGKTPALAWREFQMRFATAQEVDAWFLTEMNIAVVTGVISGVVVIDADDLAAMRWCTRHLPYTPWQTKTWHGFHLWYRHPGGRVPNRARIDTLDGKLAIDLRGDGGFVIAPGSRHASGTYYLGAGDWSASRDRVQFFEPRWLARPLRSASRSPGPRPTGNLIERARRYLDAVPKPEIGHGSDVATLSAACRLARGFGLPAADVNSLLWDWAGGRPGWSREWVAQKVANAERYGSEPWGALR